MKMKFFEKAKAASEMSDFRRIHIGSVVVYKNKVVSVGWNTTKGSPIQREYNKYRFGKDDKDKGCLHSEMMAMNNIPSNIEPKHLSIYVYREGSGGELRMSRLCPACMQRAIDLGIRDIYYTTERGYCHEEIS